MITFIEFFLTFFFGYIITNCLEANSEISDAFLTPGSIIWRLSLNLIPIALREILARLNLQCLLKILA